MINNDLGNNKPKTVSMRWLWEKSLILIKFRGLCSWVEINFNLSPSGVQGSVLSYICWRSINGKQITLYLCNKCVIKYKIGEVS